MHKNDRGEAPAILKRGAITLGAALAVFAAIVFAGAGMILAGRAGEDAAKAIMILALIAGGLSGYGGWRLIGRHRTKRRKF